MPIGSVLVLIGAFVAAAASSLAAGGDIGQAQAAVSSPAWFPPNSPQNPYKRLFKQSGEEHLARRVVEQELPRPAERAPLTKPTVVCGMVLIPGDANVDPRMRVFPPKDDSTTYTIRAVKPPICHPE